MVETLHVHVANKKYKIERKFTFFGKYQTYFISWVENIRNFTCAAHSWKFWCFQHTRWNIFGIPLKKVNILYLSHDNAFGSDIMPYNKIDKPLVVYSFSGNIMTSIITLNKIRENIDVFTPKMQLFERYFNAMQASHFITFPLLFL